MLFGSSFIFYMLIYQIHITIYHNMLIRKQWLHTTTILNIIQIQYISQRKESPKNPSTMYDKKSIQKFFQTQNITIRKSIRQLDMGYESFTPTHTITKKSDVNILVVGPPQSGKSTLLRTLHYALNGNLSYYLETRQLSEINFDRYQIKKNKKCVIEGLTKVKQMDQKLGVYGYQINFGLGNNQYKSPIDKYARALQFLNNRTLGCIGHSITGSSMSGINYIIICLNMIEKLSKQQSTAIGYFINELQQKKLKFTIIGTHVDKIINKTAGNPDETIKKKNQQQLQIANLMDQWKKSIHSQLLHKNYLDVYCMENYCHIWNKDDFENSETINYYALSLLEKCIRKVLQNDKIKKINLSSKFFCF